MVVFLSMTKIVWNMGPYCSELELYCFGLPSAQMNAETRMISRLCCPRKKDTMGSRTNIEDLCSQLKTDFIALSLTAIPKSYSLNSPNFFLSIIESQSCNLIHGRCCTYIGRVMRGRNGKYTETLWKCGQITIRFFLSPIILIWLYFDFFSNASKFFHAPINRCIHDFIFHIFTSRAY